MGVNVPDSLSHQLIALNECQDFLMAGERYLGQVCEKSQSSFPIAQVPASKLADHHWVHQNLVLVKQ